MPPGSPSHQRALIRPDMPRLMLCRALPVYSPTLTLVESGSVWRRRIRISRSHMAAVDTDLSTPGCYLPILGAKTFLRNPESHDGLSEKKLTV